MNQAAVSCSIAENVCTITVSGDNKGSVSHALVGWYLKDGETVYTASENKNIFRKTTNSSGVVTAYGFMIGNPKPATIGSVSDYFYDSYAVVLTSNESYSFVIPGAGMAKITLNVSAEG